jgi:hypothetical protein
MKNLEEKNRIMRKDYAMKTLYELMSKVDVSAETARADHEEIVCPVCGSTNIWEENSNR